MLAAHGLGGAPLFVVPEAPLHDGLLPEPVVAPLRGWLSDLAADAAHARRRRPPDPDGALDSLRPRTAGLAAQAAGAGRRRAAAAVATPTRPTRARSPTVDEGMRDGSLLRGEVLARWQEFVGTGELMRALQDRVGRLRDRLTRGVTGRPAAGHRADRGAGVGRRACSSAPPRTGPPSARRPRGGRAPPGRPCCATADARLDRSSPNLRDAVERTVRDWQGAVLDLVRREGAAQPHHRADRRVRRQRGRAVVMIAVFASTAGIPTGAEVGVAGGTTVLSQKVLEAVFGDQAVRRLADEARADLRDRVGALLAGEEARFTDLLAAHATDLRDAEALERAATAVEAAR